MKLFDQCYRLPLNLTISRRTGYQSCWRGGWRGGFPHGGCWGPMVEASRLWIGHMVKYFRKILPRILLLSHLYTKNEWLFLIFESQNGAGGRAHPWVLISTSWLGASLSISLSKCLPSPNKSYSSRRKPEGIYLSYNSDSWGVILHKAAMWRGLAFVIFWQATMGGFDMHMNLLHREGFTKKCRSHSWLQGCIGVGVAADQNKESTHKHYQHTFAT